MNDKARARLMKTGWHEGRRYPAEGVAERLQQRGFTLFAAARAFLERYGGVRARGDTTHWRGTTTDFHTDPDDVATDRSCIEEWEQVTGTRVFPIGATAYDDCILIMDEHGRVFGVDQYTVITYWADDAEELLDMVLGYGGTFRPVEADDRRPVDGER